MSLKKEITLEWGDKSHTIKPDFDLAYRIENSINLTKFTMQVANDDTRYTHAAHFISILLAESGCHVSGEEIWTQMFSNGNISRDTVNEMLERIFTGIYPEVEERKPVKKNSRKKMKS